MSFIRLPAFIQIEELEVQEKDVQTIDQALSMWRRYVLYEKATSKTHMYAIMKAIAWLYEAIRYEPEIQKGINLDDFFSSLKITNKMMGCSFLFQDDAQPLLEALIRNKTITEWSFAGDINKNFH